MGAAEARLYDLDNGALLAHVDVPAFWDDERVQQAPVVSERGDVVLVATQFQTVALKVKVRRDAGAATAAAARARARGRRRRPRLARVRGAGPLLL